MILKHRSLALGKELPAGAGIIRGVRLLPQQAWITWGSQYYWQRYGRKFMPLAYGGTENFLSTLRSWELP